ncbi:MAG: DUF4333 domain-containing protein [Mycobacterium sp.]|nr:DUF4333 domain-containing protein [Mycobacterium sp.]
MRGVGICSGVVAAVLIGATVSGCHFSASIGGGPPVVGKADLQKDITDRLTKAGQTPQSVNCAEDLVGEVDKTTRCEVVLSETNAIEPIVKTTKVEGTTVSYEMTPALNQNQLQQQVGMLMKQNGMAADTVTCAGGLEGVVDNETTCSVKGDGETTETSVKVTEVNGLLMNFQIYPA